MAQREVKYREVPFRHHLDQSSRSQELRLNDRRKIANPRASQQRGRQPVVLIDRQIRLERDRRLVFSVRVNELPCVLRSPEGESEEPVRWEILRRSWRLVLLQVFGACDELMAVGQNPPRDKGRIFQLADPKGEIHAFRDLVHDPLSDKDLDVDIRKLFLESDDYRREQ